MVFRPRMDEFKDFPRFIAYMEELGAHKVGLAKVLSKCCCYVVHSCSELHNVY